MANSDKNITITPNRNLSGQPQIAFTGLGNVPITLKVLDDSNGTLSFEGSSGQLFSIDNNLTSGSIFSVNDVSGIPSIDVNANGTVSIAGFNGNVGIGNTSPSNKLDVTGNFRTTGSLTCGAATLATSGDAPMFVARAWANFNGSTLNNSTGTYSQTGTTVTITITNHNLTTSNQVYLDFTSGTAVDGLYVVTVTGSNTFTVQQASRTTSGNVSLIKTTIRGSGNVSSITRNGTGDYTVSFITPMPDANYCVQGTAAGATALHDLFHNLNRTNTEHAANLSCRNSGNTATNIEHLYVCIFR
jgi:hypothetical protein